jgi:hypothetical protein
MNASYNILSINEFTYKLKINGDYAENLYNVIIKMLKACHLDNETNTVFISAENIIPFKQYIIEQQNKRLSHQTCVKLIDDLSKQILYLYKFGYTFYGFDIDDILIIDNNFIFCSTQYLYPLYHDKIIFVSPIKQPYFSNPELYKLTSLPAEISHKSCYYSLGLLVSFVLLNSHLLVTHEIKTPDQIDKIINPLYNTKIYWFIKRCLDEDVTKRILLLI